MFAEANTSSGNPSGIGGNYTLRENLHGARYGEVLLVTGRLNKIEASVYNTLGLNDCPDDLWTALDPEAIKKQFKARAVILNGPRYFLMDKIAIADPGQEIVEFGGLQMRRLAAVPLPLKSVLGGIHHDPYSENSVRRTTIYIYNEGREVYELIAPDGTAYVMQSYSLQVDPALKEADLASLGDRLRLPEGWQFRVRRLPEEWRLEIDGEARVIQDELQNTYQRV